MNEYETEMQHGIAPQQGEQRLVIGQTHVNGIPFVVSAKADDNLGVVGMRAEIAKLRALGSVEWVSEPSRFTDPRDEWCPWCGNYRHSGHRADCARQLALGITPEPQP